MIFWIILSLFIFSQLRGLTNIDPGDEFAYFYFGKLISEGKVPHKDFFNSHPPLHIFILSAIYFLTNLDPITATCLSLSRHPLTMKEKTKFSQSIPKIPGQLTEFPDMDSPERLRLMLFEEKHIENT